VVVVEEFLVTLSLVVVGLVAVATLKEPLLSQRRHTASSSELEALAAHRAASAPRDQTAPDSLRQQSVAARGATLMTPIRPHQMAVRLVAHPGLPEEQQVQHSRATAVA
jgi:Tfp pilus assembly protein PilX